MEDGTRQPDRPEVRRWSPRYRFVVIVVYLLVVVGLTALSLQSVASADGPAGTGSVLRWLPIGLVLVLSSVGINLVPAVVGKVWRDPDQANIGFVDLTGWLWRTLRPPLRAFWVLLAVAALVAGGVVIRPESTDLEPGRLRIMTAFVPNPNDPRTLLLEQWNRLHPQNPAEFDFASGETDQQHERMVNDVRPGGPHRADIYVLDLVWMAEFAEQDYLRELVHPRLSETQLSDFLPNVLATCKWEEKLWALPFNTDAGLLFYRSDLPDVPAPESWDAYFGSSALVPFAAAKNASPKIEAANAAQLADEEMLTITALEAIWAAGGEVVGPNGQLLLTPDGSIDFTPEDLRGIEKLAAASKNPELVTHDAGQTTDGSAVEVFASGRTPYMRNWPVARDDIGDRVPFKVVAPTTASVLGGQNLAISAASDKPRAAQALIEFLTSPSSQLILSELGGFAPTRQSAYGIAKRPFSQQLRVAVERARPRPITGCYTEFSRTFRRGIGRALNAGGELEPDFAKQAADAWRCVGTR
ncbi:extracellular solute-binding protein [Saccharothrix texasensis]|uniref:Multiple sugar transport system substrate-binding protein n=1 Tax=Saccharothrix texasensis TaxID=103734 RepID=A0A3N1HHR5_9PSEU|nr:extracellular solute-binding protein [Saccharothrix texasensis]ROP41981.1 multiple sugar transport system substrate-binding protein [Saccharothrix texasensis]